MKKYLTTYRKVPETDTIQMTISDAGKADLENARAIICGNACMVFSSFSGEEIRQMEEIAPWMLSQYNEYGETVFRLTLAEESAGFIHKDEASFVGSGTCAATDGSAVATILFPPADDENSVELVLGAIGDGLRRLEETEQMILLAFSGKEIGERKIRSGIIRI